MDPLCTFNFFLYPAAEEAECSCSVPLKTALALTPNQRVHRETSFFWVSTTSTKLKFTLKSLVYGRVPANASYTHSFWPLASCPKSFFFGGVTGD